MFNRRRRNSEPPKREPPAEPGGGRGPATQPVRRLTFEFDADDIRLVGEQRVVMRLPISAELRDDQPRGGFWFTVEDAEGRALYRRTLASPLGRDLEVFRRTEEESIARVRVERPRGAFSVLIPDRPDATAISLHGPEGGIRAMQKGPTELARFTLDARPGKGQVDYGRK